MSVIRIGLAIFCMLLCTFAFLLPERSAFSFNLDYLDYLNSRGRYFQCHFNNNNTGNNNQKSNEEDEVDEEATDRSNHADVWSVVILVSVDNNQNLTDFLVFAHP